MSERDKAVIRFSAGGTLKGYLKDFSPGADEIVLEETDGSRVHRINVAEVKAVFFVRSFEGVRSYREKKKYGIAKAKGNRLFIKFRDGESLVGFLEGEVPWDKGFFLSRIEGPKGFFLLPVDEGTNNIKVFVIGSSVEDVTVVP